MSTTVLLAAGARDARAPRAASALRRVRDRSRRPARAPDVVIAGDDAELERWCGEAPVIVLGSPSRRPASRVRAFRRGCDDYVARPFHYEELVERIRAVLRRSAAAVRRLLVAGSSRVDLEARLADGPGAPLALSQKEYALLVRLAADPKRVFTRTSCCATSGATGRATRTRTLESHVSRLRRKLRAGSTPTTLVHARTSGGSATPRGCAGAKLSGRRRPGDDAAGVSGTIGRPRRVAPTEHRASRRSAR